MDLSNIIKLIQFLAICVLSLLKVVNASVEPVTPIAAAPTSTLTNEPMMKKKFSYYVEIKGWKGYQWFPYDRIDCAGSIIASNWVLTSALCNPSYDFDSYNYVVTIDKSTLHDGKEIKGKRMVKYYSGAIALIETEKIQFTNDVQPIQLPTGVYRNMNFSGNDIFLAGMRQERTGIIFLSLGLEETDIHFHDSYNKCLEYKPNFFSTCGFVKFYVHVGGTGSPIVLRSPHGFVQVGVLKKTECYQHFIVTFRVDVFIKWIENITRLHFD